MQLTGAGNAEGTGMPQVGSYLQKKGGRAMKSMLSSLFSRLTPLSDLERLILEEAKACLSPETAVLWQRQVDEINDVQRAVGGGGMALRRTLRGKLVFNESIAFPNKAAALHVATVVLQVDGGFAPVNAFVSSSEGFLSSIVYEGNAAYLEQLSKAKQAFEISVEAHCINDPGVV